MNEFSIISKYLKKLSINNISARGLNDDVFFNKKNNLVISVDTYNEGIHFPNIKNPDLVIKKIIRSSISDIICKGVVPKFYFISASFKKKAINKKKLELIIKSLKSEQKKFNIKLSGGDTTLSSTNSFTIVSVGFAKKIISRNKCSINDDIYITGNIGDPYIGLQIINKKFNTLNKKLKNFFVNCYYIPNIPIKISSHLNTFASSSIDISDGLIDDLNKLINKQKLYYQIYLNKIPISNKFKLIHKLFNIDKKKYLFNGDDYQTLFTAPKRNRHKILNFSKKMNQKITLIGTISNKFNGNILFDGKNPINLLKFKGYSHKF